MQTVFVMQLGFCGLDMELWKALQQQPGQAVPDMTALGFNGKYV